MGRRRFATRLGARVATRVAVGRYGERRYGHHRRRHRRPRGRCSQPSFSSQSRSRRNRPIHALYARRIATKHRQPLARAFGCVGLLASRYSPAWLRAKATQARVQARSLRVVWPVARHGEGGSHTRLDDGEDRIEHPDRASCARFGRACRKNPQRHVHRAQ